MMQPQARDHLEPANEARNRFSPSVPRRSVAPCSPDFRPVATRTMRRYISGVLSQDRGYLLWQWQETNTEDKSLDSKTV